MIAPVPAHFLMIAPVPAHFLMFAGLVEEEFGGFGFVLQFIAHHANASLAANIGFTTWLRSSRLTGVGVLPVLICRPLRFVCLNHGGKASSICLDHLVLPKQYHLPQPSLHTPLFTLRLPFFIPHIAIGIDMRSGCSQVYFKVVAAKFFI